MSTKCSIASGPTFHLYHELTLDSVQPEDVFLDIEDTQELLVEKDFSNSLRTRVQLPCDLLDQVAIAWIRHRKLQGSMGGPVGNDWGSPDCDFE